MAGLNDYLGKKEKKRLKDISKSFRGDQKLDRFLDRVGAALKRTIEGMAPTPKSEERKRLEKERLDRFKRHKVKIK